MYRAPKRELVSLVLDMAPEAEIREHFRIKESTDLRDRLLQRRLRDLRAFIKGLGEQANHRTSLLDEDYPLGSAPTIYVIRVLGRPDLATLRDTLQELSAGGRRSGIEFAEDRPVRVMYVSSPPSRLPNDERVWETILTYERRIEFLDADPEAPSYGDKAVVWALERALLWFADRDVESMLLASTQFTSVRAALELLRLKCNINCGTPDLSEATLKRIAGDARPRNASFRRVEPLANTLTPDARAITVYDDNLPNTGIYKTLTAERGNEQTAGYYMGHPGLLIGGVGISRRNARIWTPRHLHKKELCALGLSVLERIEAELRRMKADDVPTYLRIHRRVPLRIAGKLITGEARIGAEHLIMAIARAEQGDGTYDVSEHLFEFVTHSKKLGLTTGVAYECPSCGETLLTCSQCGSPMSIDPGKHIEAHCQPHSETVDISTDFECDCGESVQVSDPYSLVFMCPSPDTVEALSGFLESISEVTAPLFIITGGQLRVLRGLRSGDDGVLRLEDLDLWRTRGRIHTHALHDEPAVRRLAHGLKEKCGSGGSKEACKRCIDGTLKEEDMYNDRLCLLRAFGIPINKGFDGIHHGNEIADIIYEDRYNGREVILGIHVKSYQRCSNKTGLGRSHASVTSLYQQLCFSLYLDAIGKIALDIVGVAVPNRLNERVRDSMHSVITRLGKGFVVVEEDDWLKIIDRAREEIIYAGIES